MKLLTDQEIKEQLVNLPEWKLSGKEISRTFVFTDFTEAISFVHKVAQVAEEMNHHPDIDIRYNKVKITVSTHSAGGLTEKDFQLAEKL